MPVPKKHLFSESELVALRRSFYQQAPIVASALMEDDTEDAAKWTVELIETLMELIAELPE